MSFLKVCFAVLFSLFLARTASAQAIDTACEVDIVSPKFGKILNNYPREYEVSWRNLQSYCGVTSYTVEIDCLDCCGGGEWCSDQRSIAPNYWKHHTYKNAQSTMTPGAISIFKPDAYWGDNMARWRVIANTTNLRRVSTWGDFRFLTGSKPVNTTNSVLR